jgi:hypothetical protein
VVLEVVPEIMPIICHIITYYKQLNYNILISASQASKDICLTNSNHQKLARLRSKSQRKQQWSGSFHLIRFLYGPPTA